MVSGWFRTQNLWKSESCKKQHNFLAPVTPCILIQMSLIYAYASYASLPIFFCVGLLTLFTNPHRLHDISTPEFQPQNFNPEISILEFQPWNFNPGISTPEFQPRKPPWNLKHQGWRTSKLQTFQPRNFLPCLRREVRGDFNIHGTKYFLYAVSIKNQKVMML